VGMPLDRGPRNIRGRLRERSQDRAGGRAVAVVGGPVRRIDRSTVRFVGRAELRLVERRGVGRVRYEVHERCFRLTSEPDREVLVLGHRHTATGRTGVGPSSAPAQAVVVMHADVLPHSSRANRTHVRTSSVSVVNGWKVEGPVMPERPMFPMPQCCGFGPSRITVHIRHVQA
jgi:hypothetical protein